MAVTAVPVALVERKVPVAMVVPAEVDTAQPSQPTRHSREVMAAMAAEAAMAAAVAVAAVARLTGFMLTVKAALI